MKRESVVVAHDGILQLITHVRGQKVVLDSNLAHLYDVTTKVLPQAVAMLLSRASLSRDAVLITGFD